MPKKKKTATKTTAKKTAKKVLAKKPVAKKPVPKKAAPKVKPPVVSEVPVVTPEVVVPPPAPVKTEAEKIWEEIKNLPIQMFGLPFQLVANHCTFYPVEPSRLYVTIRSSATLPSLEAAIAPNFTVELADKWVIISRVPQVPQFPGRR